jgi:hypothetical protein
VVITIHPSAVPVALRRDGEGQGIGVGRDHALPPFSRWAVFASVSRFK